MFGFCGRSYGAHRWIFCHLNAVPLSTPLEVCHSCDNPACVRPTHLFLDDHAGNIRDMVSKGRRATTANEANPNAKLTSGIVARAREAVRNGARITHIAAAHGVTVATLSAAVAGKTWASVDGAIAIEDRAPLRGERAPLVVLTETQVLEIVARCKSGKESGAAIARDYGVDAGTVYAILKGKSWLHLGVAGTAELKRVNSGERNPRARLTAQLAAEIRAAHGSGVPGPELARRHNVGNSTIYRVLRGECWAA